MQFLVLTTQSRPACSKESLILSTIDHTCTKVLTLKPSHLIARAVVHAVVVARDHSHEQVCPAVAGWCRKIGPVLVRELVHLLIPADHVVQLEGTHCDRIRRGGGISVDDHGHQRACPQLLYHVRERFIVHGHPSVFTSSQRHQHQLSRQTRLEIRTLVVAGNLDEADILA